MRRMLRLTLPVLIVVAGAAVTYGIATLKPEVKPEAPASKPPLVKVMTPRTQAVTLSVKTQGTVQPAREIDLVAQVSGQVVGVNDYFAKGEFFESGVTLVQIDDRDYHYQLARAEAGIADAKRLLAEEKARALQAKREWRNLGSEEANALFLREPQVEAAEAGVKAATAERNQAALNLERTAIKTPFAGRVRQKHVDLGQYVTAGSPVARIYDTQKVEIRLPLTNRQLAFVDLPQGVQKSAEGELFQPEVTLSALRGDQRLTWQGRIVRTEAEVDATSRVTYAVAEILQPFAIEASADQLPLLIGMFVEAEVMGKTFDEVYELPRHALYKANQLWLVGADEKLHLKTVRVLQSDSRRLLFTGDLASDERVVISHLHSPIEGMAVDVIGDEVLAAQQESVQ